MYGMNNAVRVSVSMDCEILTGDSLESSPSSEYWRKKMVDIDMFFFKGKDYMWAQLHYSPNEQYLCPQF